MKFSPGTVYDSEISDLVVSDIRFPTSKTFAGSDAVHVSPDYSCAYVVISIDGHHIKGYGFAFTIGRGTEIVVEAINAYKYLVKGKTLKSIYGDFKSFWRSLTNESQLRWLGPEKGVVHLAVAAIINALWDLWARIERKPLWKLLTDMSPEALVSCIDFRYITDVLAPDEAVEILQENVATKQDREFRGPILRTLHERQLLAEGFPAYVTSAGWMGYSDEKITRLCREAVDEGWNSFKMKVGVDIESDIKRADLIRSVIGYDRKLMMDANQVWDVGQAIDWSHKLAPFQPYWMEEPTNPDDVLGHAAIAQALRGVGVRVATGEHCQNRVVFKQLLSAGALDVCQIDACRLAGVNEVLAVLLMAAKFNVPVCPHAGGVGLCELVQHLSIFNYICVAPTLDDTMTEYSDHLHEHFVHPVRVQNGRYLIPMEPGYSSEMKQKSLEMYHYPNGKAWSEEQINP